MSALTADIAEPASAPASFRSFVIPSPSRRAAFYLELLLPVRVPCAAHRPRVVQVHSPGPTCARSAVSARHVRDSPFAGAQPSKTAQPSWLRDWRAGIHRAREDTVRAHLPKQTSQ